MKKLLSTLIVLIPLVLIIALFAVTNTANISKDIAVTNIVILNQGDEGVFDIDLANYNSTNLLYIEDLQIVAKSDNNNDVEIIISNSYLGEVDTKNVNEKGYSTKGKNRGYGLPLVKNILEHSDIFSSETITCNDIYTQKLNIKGK